MSKDKNLSDEEMRKAADGIPEIPTKEIARSRLRELDDDDLRRAIGLSGQV